MLHATSARWLLAIVLTIVLLLTPTSAAAHEHREVGGYEFTVGFRNEPALINQPNGLHLGVLRIETGETDEDEESDEEEAGGHEGGEPVEGLQESLQAEIIYGGEMKTLELRAVPGEHGVYTADVFPTAEGAYTFRIFGTIEGLEIDESFTGGPDTFSEVEPLTTVAFPAVDGDSATSAAEAQDAADSARTLAIVGLIAGLLGLAAGAAGIVMAMNARNRRPAEATAARETDN